MAQFIEHVLDFNETCEPTKVMAADLDNDGDLDVLCMSDRNDWLNWCENLGGGQFGTWQVIRQSVGTFGTGSFDTADVDLDGDEDVLSIWTDYGMAGVNLNLGNGTFSPFLSLGASNSLATYGELCTGDLDGDGDPDVLTARNGGSGLVWCANDGSGSFSPEQVVLPGSYSVPRSPRTIDLDGDQDQDILFVNVSQLVVAYTNGSGGFYGGPIGTPTTNAMNVADVNGDDLPDVIYGTGNGLSWIMNEGMNQWAAPLSIGSAGAPIGHIAPADLDGDGDMDLLVSIEDADLLGWFMNDGSGTFGPLVPIVSDAQGAGSVTAADMDGTGTLDVLFAERIGSTVRWALNTGGGAFGALTTLSTGPTGVTLCSDMDGDGDLDVVVGPGSDDRVEWYRNLGNGTFGAQEVVSLNARAGGSVTTPDLNGDGLVDVVHTSSQNGTNQHFIQASFGQGGGAFAAAVVLATVSSIQGFHTFDVDGDGDVDSVFGHDGTSSTPDTLSWCANDGNGNLAQPVAITTATQLSLVGTVDLDGDLDLDLLSLELDDDRLVWYGNEGAGLFSGPFPIITALTASGLAVYPGDLDGDGDLDLVVHDSYTLFSCINQGNGVFDPPLPIAQPYNAPLALADMDQDGDPDMIMENFVIFPVLTGSVAVLLNDGSGSFSSTTTIIDWDTYMIGTARVADMDDDGDADLVCNRAMNYFGAASHLYWYENPGLSTSLNAPFASPRLHAWPSPFTDRLWVGGDLPFSADHRIDLLDAQGRILLSSRGNGTKELLIPRGALASGLYLLRVSRNGIVLATARVVAE